MSKAQTEKSSLLHQSKFTDEQNVLVEDLRIAMRNISLGPNRFSTNYQKIKRAIDTYDQVVRSNDDRSMKFFISLVWIVTGIVACFASGR